MEEIVRTWLSDWRPLMVFESITDRILIDLESTFGRRYCYLSVQSSSSYAVPSVLHVLCNTLVGAYVSLLWCTIFFFMEWSYHGSYVRVMGHVIPAL